MSWAPASPLARRLLVAGVLPREVLEPAEREARGDDLALALALVRGGRLPADHAERYLRELSASAAALGPAPLPGYRRVRELGRGGMGAVFEVVHEATGQHYALKQLLGAGGEACGEEQEQERERFAREAQTLASLDHPGLVRVHSARLEGSSPCFVQELLPKGSLEDRLRGGPLATEAARRVAREVAEALAYLHERGVLHRDLKPANLLFDAEGRARLTDFGLARVRGGRTLTQTGEVLGTPGYMPPEQITDSHRVDERSEVYAWGALLYALLTGEPPFLRGGVFATLDAVLNEAPRPPQELNPEADPALAALCLRALAKDPQARPASVRELLAALDAGAKPPAGGRALALGVVLGGGAALLVAGGALLAFAASGAWPGSEQPTRSPSQGGGLLPSAAVPAPSGPQDEALAPCLRLPERPAVWSQDSSPVCPFREFVPSLRAVEPRLAQVEQDLELLELLYGEDLPKFGSQGRILQLRLTREQVAVEWKSALGEGKLKALIGESSARGWRSLTRALWFVRILRRTPTVFDDIISKEARAGELRLEGDFELGELLALAEAGLATGDGTDAGCGELLRRSRGGTSARQAWAELRALNQGIWSASASPPGAALEECVATPWAEEETQARRARRLLGELRLGGGPEWVRACTGVEELLGDWPAAGALTKGGANRLKASRRALQGQPKTEGVVFGALVVELAEALVGTRRDLLDLARAFQRSHQALGSQEGPERSWCALLALIGLERAGANEQAARNFGELGKTLAWAGFTRAAQGAIFLGEGEVAAGGLARGMGGGLKAPTSRAEAWARLEPLWRAARRIELGQAGIEELDALRD